MKRISRQQPEARFATGRATASRVRLAAVLVAAFMTVLAVSTEAAELTAMQATELTASQIVERVHAAAGGEAWHSAGSNIMRGEATLCRDGDPTRCIHADRYVMYRVYPTELRHGAHAGSGKFRLDAFHGDAVLFQAAFDGERSYNQDGPLPPDRASGDEATAFGFSAIRFALEPGFKLERLTDDQVEGHACHFLRVTDPTGTRTLFGIDRETFAVRSAGWPTPKGYHQRLYSDFYKVGDSAFVQPGRVRHFYDGVKTVDIRWTSAEIGTSIPDATFVIERRVKSTR